jgi:hypothetical protein
MTTTADILDLARSARPIDDADWGSPRQIEAENLFMAAVEARLPIRKLSALHDYSLKATTEEWIDEALRLMGVQQ